MLTIKELERETLTAKHRRLLQERCKHKDVYSSTMLSQNGTFTNSVCFDCGKSWHIAAHTPHQTGGAA